MCGDDHDDGDDEEEEGRGVGQGGCNGGIMSIRHCKCLMGCESGGRCLIDETWTFACLDKRGDTLVTSGAQTQRGNLIK